MDKSFVLVVSSGSVRISDSGKQQFMDEPLKVSGPALCSDQGKLQSKVWLLRSLSSNFLSCICWRFCPFYLILFLCTSEKTLSPFSLQLTHPFFALSLKLSKLMTSLYSKMWVQWIYSYDQYQEFSAIHCILFESTSNPPALKIMKIVINLR